MRPLPPERKIGTCEDAGLTWTETDRYGQPLTYTTPADLRRLKVPADLTPWNAAILAFIRALPEDTRVILFWC